MAYLTGSANSLTDLIAALQSACTSNGYTLSGNVIHKGTLFCEVKLGRFPITEAPNNAAISVRSCNGIDGSNLPTDAAPYEAFIGRLRSSTSPSVYADWDWPVTYHIHINTAPDEVVMVVNYDAGQRYQILMFGQSPAPGNLGTGNWHYAHIPNTGTGDAPSVSGHAFAPGGSVMTRYYGLIVGFGPFWWSAQGFSISYGIRQNSMCHGVIDDTTELPRWCADRGSMNGTAGGHVVCAGEMAHPLLFNTPNAWNQQTSLVRIEVFQARVSSKVSHILSIEHSRMCRNDFIDPGDVIDLAPDRWKVYPLHKKNTASRNGNPNNSTPTDHSGTVALAVRYDGP